MKQIKLIDRSRATYEIPATRVITVRPAKVLMGSIDSQSNGTHTELDMDIVELGGSWS